MKDLIEEIVLEIVDKFHNERDAIILKAFKEKGIIIDLSLENKKRFKSVVVERQDGKETYYYNDGSSEGLRIITFEIQAPVWGFNDDCTTLKSELNYY